MVCTVRSRSEAVHSEQLDTITTHTSKATLVRARDSFSSSPICRIVAPSAKSRVNRTPGAPPVLCTTRLFSVNAQNRLCACGNHVATFPLPCSPSPAKRPSTACASLSTPPSSAPMHGSLHHILPRPRDRRIIVGRPRRAVFVQPDSSKSLSKGFIGVGRVPGSRRRRRSSPTTATTTVVPSSSTSRSGPLGKSLTGGLQDDEERLPSWRGPQLEGVREVVPRGDLAEEGLFVLWGGGC